MQNKDFQYFKLFRDVCKVVNSSLDLKEVLKLITENVGHVLDVKACTVSFGTGNAIYWKSVQPME